MGSRALDIFFFPPNRLTELGVQLQSSPANSAAELADVETGRDCVASCIFWPPGFVVSNQLGVPQVCKLFGLSFAESR